MSNIFEDYGADFEKKILYNLISDKQFLEQVNGIIKPEYFEVKAHRYIVNVILQVYKKHGKPCTFDTFKIYLKQFNDHIAKKQALKIAFNLTEEDCSDYIDDYEVIQQETLNYCRRQNWKNGFVESLDLIEEFKFNEAQQKLEIAFYEGSDVSKGIDYDDIQDRLNTQPRENIIPTPWEPLNRRIGGGIGSGELMVIVGGMGSGKSHQACNFALYGKKQKHDVILYSLELSEAYLRKRVDTILLQEDLEDREPKDYIEQVAKELQKCPDGKLVIKKMNAGITPIDIKNDIKMRRAGGLNPKMIIIDYMDLMQPINTFDRKAQIWDKLEVITREIRNVVCDGENISAIAYAQGNTGSLELSAIWAHNTSGGAKRLHPADIIGGYARNTAMKEQDIANFTMIKNRFGKDGFLLECNTDYSISRIDMSDTEKFASEDTFKDTKEIHEDIMKKLKDKINGKPKNE